MPGEISLVRPVRPMFPASTIRVVVTDLNTAAKTFWSLDQDLRELTHTGPHAFGLTRAYELPDHSLVLFGSVNARGGTAAAARLYSDNAFAIFLIAPLHESFTLSDAVPTNSAAEYVAVRALVHPAPGTPEASRPGHIVTNETVLAWLEINPRS